MLLFSFESKKWLIHWFGCKLAISNMFWKLIFRTNFQYLCRFVNQIWFYDFISLNFWRKSKDTQKQKYIQNKPRESKNLKLYNIYYYETFMKLWNSKMFTKRKKRIKQMFGWVGVCVWIWRNSIVCLFVCVYNYIIFVFFKKKVDILLSVFVVCVLND